MGRMAEAYEAGDFGAHQPGTDRGLRSRRYASNDYYPYAPAVGKTSTSAKAAQATQTKFNEKQLKVLSHLERADLTNTEIFAREAGLSPGELRRYCALRALERGLQPRAGELCLKGKIFDSGFTRKNPNGRAETVWTTVNPAKPQSKQGILL